jgi:FtsH-binding integral membrane protein
MDYRMSAAESLNTAVAGVLGRMTLGVFGTMLVAALVVSSGLVPVLFSGFFGYVLIFAPLVMSLFLMVRGSSMSPEAVKFFYVAFATVMGVSLSLIFSMFTTASIVQALIGTTVSFGALAAWGYFTRRDLSGLGPFFFAGVIGLIVAGLFNIWFESSALQTTLNVLAVIIFLGLTAYDMNRIRDMFWNASQDTINHIQWLAALSLYINFINIFVNLLQLFGNRE